MYEPRIYLNTLWSPRASVSDFLLVLHTKNSGSALPTILYYHVYEPRTCVNEFVHTCASVNGRVT